MGQNRKEPYWARYVKSWKKNRQNIKLKSKNM